MGPPSEALDISDKKEALEESLREWWHERNSSWEIDDADDTGESTSETSHGGGGGDVWDHMPEIDSKEVTRAGSVCEEYLDTDFDPSLVREGGYGSIDDLVDDLVPKLIEKEKEAE
jgi:hypothetical protein